MVVTVIAGCVFTLFAVRAGHTSLGTYFDELPAGLARTIFSFGTGIIIYRFKDRAARTETSLSLVALIVVGLALELNPPPSINLSYSLLMTLVGSPLIIFLAAKIEPTPGLRAGFAFLGNVSFPIYALHYPIIGMWRFLGRSLHLQPAVIGGLFLSSLVALSWVAYLADRKARAWLRHLILPRVTSPTVQM
jgi:peptidoglycan/LPS O-acetylase OafA/YrhL